MKKEPSNVSFEDDDDDDDESASDFLARVVTPSVLPPRSIPNSAQSSPRITPNTSLKQHGNGGSKFANVVNTNKITNQYAGKFSSNKTPNQMKKDPSRVSHNDDEEEADDEDASDFLARVVTPALPPRSIPNSAHASPRVIQNGGGGTTTPISNSYASHNHSFPNGVINGIATPSSSQRQLVHGKADKNGVVLSNNKTKWDSIDDNEGDDNEGEVFVSRVPSSTSVIGMNGITGVSSSSKNKSVRNDMESPQQPSMLLESQTYGENSTSTPYVKDSSKTSLLYAINRSRTPSEEFEVI